MTACSPQPLHPVFVPAHAADQLHRHCIVSFHIALCNFDCVSWQDLLYVQRIVRLGGAVDDDNSNLLVAQLLYLDSIGKKDITMYVNSPGGSVTAGWSLPHHHLSIDIVPQITCHTSQLIIAHASTTQHPAKLPYSHGAYRVAALDSHAA